jgi:hypothetical protein
MRKHRTSKRLSLFGMMLLLFMPGVALGSTDPEDLLNATRDACADLPGVSYSFVQTQTVGEDRWTITARGRQARSDDAASIGFTQGLFRFEGTIEQDGQRQPFAFAYDGQSLYGRNPGDAELKILERPSMHDIFEALDPRLRLVGMPPLTAAEPFADAPDRGTVLTAAEVRDAQPVGGVACQALVVRIAATAPDGSKHDLESSWTIGRDDHLPRIHESRTGRLEIRELKVLSADEAKDGASFRIADDPPTSRPARS